jgi:glycosyltransferase involved in cell wall biosynthesis
MMESHIYTPVPGSLEDSGVSLCRPKILFVGIQGSPHVARWIKMLGELDFEIHLFPIDAGPWHYGLSNLTLHIPILEGKPLLLKMRKYRALFARATRFALLSATRPGEALSRLKLRLFRHSHFVQPDVETQRPSQGPGFQTREFPVTQLLGDSADPEERVRLGRIDESENSTSLLYGPDVLAALIRDIQPDLIHSMEFQHAAYLVLAARDRISDGFPRWLATNWGSDIFYFGRLPHHARQIRRVCEAIDFYSCECHRDIALGRAFGYKGPDLPVLPNSGGMDIDHVLSLRDASPPSKRKLIMVKGYDHFAGRAMMSLDLLERFANRLKDYTIILFSVGVKPRARARELATAGKLNIKIIDSATHDDILRFFGHARMYLGISISDAISTSVLEAMTMGAFPIQTDTSCCTEWFIDSETGFAVPADDIEAICTRFATALIDDTLVDTAAVKNLEIIKTRLDVKVLLPLIHEFYRQTLATLPKTPSISS